MSFIMTTRDVDTDLAKLDKRFDGVIKRFDAVGERFNAIDKRFNTIDERFNAIDERFNAIDERLGAVEATCASLVKEVTEVSVRLEGQSHQILDLANNFQTFSETMGSDMKDMRTNLKNIVEMLSKVYYGPRARYLYYQCRQLILRYQIESLVGSWELPKEAKNICRTIWLLALDVLPQSPPPQPWLHAQTEDASERENLAQEKGEFGEEHTSLASNADEPEGSSDDEADIEAQINLEIENLLREASETDSNSDIKKLDASEGQRVYNKKTRHTLVPVIYSDFVNLINTYQLPYLSVIPLLPDNMQKHLSTALRQELTPPHAPTVATLHVITRRIARRLHLVHGVDIPELNAAPILWRAVRAFQGPPILYTMAKNLMERLKVPLTIHPTLAPPPALGLKKHAGDWAPIEVTISVVIIICLKLVYGFRDAINVIAEEYDPAACFPPFADYITSLRQGKEEHRRSFDRLLSLDNERTADTLTEKEIDRYLEVAERVLKRSHLGGLTPMRKYDYISSKDILTRSSIQRAYVDS
ncbi:unnamed protein product [Rhizoctonia solani]|uniref:Rrn7/TAF1B C-terminal cyclin domain-containing protein n=1 Tax=Rhizoctonia solani TaxID=456999 RepID=A0A8H2X8A8_9AGAM|nr:unnamed protein product [Rhizoctonia solani]CAE6463152.1 unnamed protein product [Rhizoctonia solani]